MTLTSCVPALGLVLLLSGCSLLFTPAENSSGDAGTVVDAATFDADSGGAADLSRAIHTIGDGDADFASFEAWKRARSGDLGNRQELLVAVDGVLPVAGVELLGDIGCRGEYRPQRNYGERLTIDLTNGAPECQVGERLSIAGSELLGPVTQAGPRGIIEIVQLRHRTYQAPIMIDGFVNTDPLHYLVLEANPVGPHQGIAGQGVTIGSVSDPPVAPSHGVEIHVDYTQLRGFEITKWAAGAAEDASLEGVRVAANHVLLDRLLIHDDGANLTNADSDGIFSNIDGIELTVRNSFIYNIARAGIILQNSTGGTLRVQSCTLHNCVASDANLYGCVVGSNVTNTTIEAVNTLAFGQNGSKPAFNFDSFSSNSSFAGSSNNASGDGSHPGEDGATFASASDLLKQVLGDADDDLHLREADVFEPPYSGGKTLPDFDVDIDGETRGASWSIGADQP